LAIIRRKGGEVRRNQEKEKRKQGELRRNQEKEKRR
jgi:hypothetical protein